MLASTPVLYAVLIAATQTPTQRQAQPPAAPARRDTIYVAAPPIVNVQAPSDTPTIVLGIAGALLLLAQLWILKGQTDLTARQTALGEQREEAEERALRSRLQAIARLAKRSCEAAVSEVDLYPSVRDWASATGAAVRLNVLEDRFLEIKAAANELAGREAAAADRAFEAFLSAANRINALADTKATIVLSAQATLQQQALGYLRTAAVELGDVAGHSEPETGLLTGADGLTGLPAQPSNPGQ